jgi:MFS family permease
MPNNFYLLWTSQILSQVTVNMMNFLLLAELYNATGSSIATSLLWVSYALPTIFFGPVGASIVDLVSRRKILIITNLLQAVVIFLYIFSHTYSIFLLFAVVVAYSFLNQFYLPAEGASLPSLVSKDKLVKANSLFFLTQQLSLIVGFGFAGIIQKIISFEGSLILCSVLLSIATISVYFLPQMNPSKKLPKNIEDLMKTFFNHILEGYRFIKNKKTILFPLGLLFLIQVGLAIITANLPIIGKEILNVSMSYVGLLVVVPSGIGATLGSVVISRLVKKNWRKKKIINIGLGILGFSVLGLVFGGLISTPILVVLVGFGFVAVNIPTLTFLQENTPVWLRGRVFGNLWFLITIATIFPIIFSGVVSEFFGVKTLLIIMALSVILILVFSLKKGQKLIEENF